MASLKKSRTSLWMQLLASLSLLAGCGTWIGNPPDKESGEGPKKNREDSEEITLVFASNQGRVFDLTDKDGNKLGTVTLTENRHVLKNIYLYADEKPDEPVFKGPYVIDLLNGEVTPKPESTNLPAGVYSKASFTGHTLQKGEIPGIADDDSLIGLVSIISGEAQVGPFTQSFNFRVNWSEELFLNDSGENGSPSEIKAGLSNELVIRIDYAKWFQINAFNDLLDEERMAKHVIESLKKNTSFNIERSQ